MTTFALIITSAVLGFIAAMYLASLRPTKDLETVTVYVEPTPERIEKKVFDKDLKRDAVDYFMVGYQACASKLTISQIIGVATERTLDLVYLVEDQRTKVLDSRATAFETGYNACKQGYLLDDGMSNKGIIFMGKMVSGVYIPHQKYVACVGVQPVHKAGNIIRPEQAPTQKATQEEVPPPLAYDDMPPPIDYEYEPIN